MPSDKPRKATETPVANRTGRRGAGRPTKYLPAFTKRAEKMALLGMTEEQMAASFEVTRPTLRAWKRQHPEFLSAITRAKDEADAEVAVSLRQRALGYSHPETLVHVHAGQVIKTRVTKRYPPDTAAAAIWLYNRQPALWRREPDPMNTPDEPTPVKIVIEVRSSRVRPTDVE